MIMMMCALSGVSNAAELTGWISHSSPWGVWKPTYGDLFPVKEIVRDLAAIGCDSVMMLDQHPRGGPLSHPTNVANCVSDKRLGGRDYVKELLEEAAKYNMKVWLGYSTPAYGKSYGKTDYTGLNHPGILNIYRSIVDEIGRKYGKHKNLAGFYWHELNASEGHNKHNSDIKEFSEFCKKNFGEAYNRKKMPETNPDDKWWRRFYLYRINIMCNFVGQMRKKAKPYGLQTSFCAYTPEVANGQSWRWGYGVVELEKVCDRIWFIGTRECSRPYQNIRGTWLDFGPSYNGANMAKNFAYAFHGKPLFMFENMAALYPDMLRKYYSYIPRYKALGDIYIARKGQTKKSMKAFYGKDNIKKWMKIITQWQGGKTIADIALVVNPTPFILQHPLNPGMKYKAYVDDLVVSITKRYDTDAFVMNSVEAISPEKLSRWPLIIIPTDMGYGLTTKMIESLRVYLKNGGTILAIATPLQTSRRDLTMPIDLCEKFFGLKIESMSPGGYVTTKGADKFWASKIMNVNSLPGTQIVTKDSNTGRPIVTRKGNAYFMTIGFNKESAPFFQKTLDKLVKPALRIARKGEIRIIKSTIKDKLVCISLYGKGEATLHLDAKKLGLKSEKLLVKDIITGNIISKTDAASLKKEGIAVKITYKDQPLVLAIGGQENIQKVKSLAFKISDFDKLYTIAGIENAEVPIMVPKKKGFKIAVYHSGYGAAELVKALNSSNKLNAFIVPRIGPEVFAASDVLILPQSTQQSYFNGSNKMIRSWIKKGGKVILTHDAVGFKKHKTHFPEIGQGISAIGGPFPEKRFTEVLVVAKSPIIASFKKDAVISHGYTDHIAIKPGANSTVLVKDKKGNPVLVVGKFGKGTVVLNGMMPGWVSIGSRAYDGKAGRPTKSELQIIMDIISYLNQGK